MSDSKQGQSVDWFTSIGTPTRESNRILPLIDGETTWRQVTHDLNSAQKYIHICMWALLSFQIETELIRKAEKTFTEPSERSGDTLFYILTSKAARGVTVRLLIWSLPGISQHILLRALGSLPKDNFEVLEEPHPKLGFSYHQKTITIDGKIAFVGGMNLREHDWDTSVHAVYDYRRTPHDTSAKKRMWMRDTKRVPTFPPRHDLMVRIEGPLLSDVEENFVQRWNATKQTGRVWSKNATLLSGISSPARVGDQKGQVVRTMPTARETPTGEFGILDSYRRAIRNARSYIYIENQYFRSESIAEELGSACEKNPKLLLIAVTKPDYLTEIEADEWWKVATATAYWTHKAFQIIKKVRPDFCLFYLQVFERDSRSKPLYVPVDLHAKVMIIDDEWWTVGSANINERSFLFDGEMNVMVHHSESAKDLRLRLWKEHLGVPCPENITEAAKLWYGHARENYNCWKSGKEPKSRVFPFAQMGPLLPNLPSALA
jgi:phosphatidylserine/phosphatidylglycerophosphate/cardiolipin synthase-like enzyme